MGSAVTYITDNILGIDPKPAPQAVAAPPMPDDPKNKTAAKDAAARRRALYSNVGRSSTILTGPSGLGSAPNSETQATPKSLLGL